MPNQKGGKKYKRGKKDDGQERALLLPEGEYQFFARVIKRLGDGRFTLICFDGVERVGKVRGKMRKRVWINEGDYVLATPRTLENEMITEKPEFETVNNKADIIHKYNDDEVRMFKKEPKAYNFNDLNTGEENQEQQLIDGLEVEFDDNCEFNFDEI